LNALGIYHRDLNPDNIVVSYSITADSTIPHVKSLKLIDFELGCALLEDTFKKYIAKKRETLNLEDVSCALPSNEAGFVYAPYATFRDPLSGAGERTAKPDPNFIFTESQAKKLWPLFEMYSCALIVQLLIDQKQNVDLMVMPEVMRNNNGVVAIRKTSRSIKGLKELLEKMTGPIDSRGNLGDYSLLVDVLAAGL
jgi:serine/threonine protein kinase